MESVVITNQFVFWGALLALVSVVASAILTRRIGMPILLVFLVVGMLAGEDGPGGIVFDNYDIAFLFGSLALAVIIFDGGLGSRMETFRVSLGPALSLATLGVLTTSMLTGLIAHWLLDWSWLESLLVGAIVGSTDAAAVFGMLHTAGLELKQRASATLEIESGSNDPMAIFLTMLLVSVLQVEGQTLGWSMLAEFASQMGLGMATGLAAGYAFTMLAPRLAIPPSLYPLLTLACGLSVFGLTNLWGGSGFLAIFIVGVIVGNSPLPHSSDIHRFHDGMAWLSQVGMFLMLGLLITPSQIQPILLPGLGIAFGLILIARPVAVILSLAPFRFPWREQAFISWCGLRGAVPIILALFPSLANLDQTEVYFELAFVVVLVSLVVQGWTIAPAARLLGLNLPQMNTTALFRSVFIGQKEDLALFIYDVAPGSQAVDVAVDKMVLPKGTGIVCVVRDGVELKSWRNSRLCSGDKVIILSQSDQPDGLSRWFAPRLDKAIPQFFGEFVLNPDAKLEAVMAVYDVSVPDHYRNLTLAEYMQRMFHNRAVVGDRVRVGSVELLVKEVRDGRINQVGLKISPPH
ncbi:MAG: potassium/proton antiporter [Pseudohongiellaceae bacterium]